MITIHSESIDELNAIYRRVKGNFRAVETIKLEQPSLAYTMKLEACKPNPMIKNLIDRAVDYCDEILDLESVSHLNFQKFLHQYEDKYVFIKQLKEAYEQQEASSQFVTLQYLAEAMDIPIVQRIPSAEFETA